MDREMLVRSLVQWGYLKTPEIIRAFLTVPREKFLPERYTSQAYEDHPLPIGFGQTISAPSMIAIMLETLDLKSGQKVLEIGAGSGYNAALLAEIVGKSGKVVTIERIPELAAFGRKNLRDTGYSHVKVVVGDGTLGYPEEAPWDRILITACSPKIPPPLIDQLKVGGKIGLPLGQHHLFQTWTVVEKTETGTKITEHGGCSFVPVIGAHGWKESD
ncbi:MAG: protein-L-isoaspartate(D-aspartate) O-methyltransferase [Candidatus Hadarchaeales archaeon]